MLVAFLPAFFVDRIGWLLVHSMWQFTLIALVMAAVLRGMRGAPTNVRYRVCLLGWISLLNSAGKTSTARLGVSQSS